MAKNIFISFPYDEQWQTKDKIINFLSKLNIGVDYSEKEDRSQTKDETIWKHLLNRIKGSSITIVIHDPSLTNWKGKALFDSNTYPIEERFHESGWVYKEIVASLRDWKENKINGIIYFVPDSLISNYYSDFSYSQSFKNSLPEIIRKNYESGYIVLVSEKDFFQNPHKFINEATKKREDQIDSQKYTIHNNLHLD